MPNEIELHRQKTTKLASTQAADTDLKSEPRPGPAGAEKEHP